MQTASYAAPSDVRGAIDLRGGGGAFLAGGTTLIDLMKCGVEQPSALIDINALPLATIEEMPQGVRIGALVRNTDAAYHAAIVERFPSVSQSILAGASAQLRNMATMGGNVLQRTRCVYFRDTAWPCNKREPGSGCSALDGYTRYHAILGTSESCIASHPSDLCVALAALDATVQLRGPGGERSVPFTEFHLEPGDTPERETVLAPGELITAIDIPFSEIARRSCYVKLRDRSSYAFALASAACALETEGGTIRAARIALGGVGTKPWRATEAERSLEGAPATRESFERAATLALGEARTRPGNAFKVTLAQRAIVRAFTTLGDAA